MVNSWWTFIISGDQKWVFWLSLKYYSHLNVDIVPPFFKEIWFEIASKATQSLMETNTIEILKLFLC